MALPTFQQLMLPILRRACERRTDVHITEIAEQIARDLALAQEDLNRITPNGQSSVFGNRIGWARSYLVKAGLLETVRRGYVRATSRAHELLAENLSEIEINTLMRYEEFVQWRVARWGSDVGAAPLSVEIDASPEELIAENFERLQADLSQEIIERVRVLTPGFFERLIIDLLLRMGYGGGREEMGKALGRSGDGGVDGVIREDALGLDVLYIQAKRYAPERAVAVSEVRDFVGSLDAHRASKGVFVTTSYFPNNAHEFVERISKRVVLIDGAELAHLMIRHNVGVRLKDSYEIKKIDEDYFVE